MQAWKQQVDGCLRTVQPGQQSFEAGDRVRVLTGPKGLRVERS